MPAATLEAFLVADLVLAATFSFEMFIRIGAAGFYTNGPASEVANGGYRGYINDPWNQVFAMHTFN